MVTYTNHKGQTQSPHMTFGETVQVAFKHRTDTMAPTYMHIHGHIPIDTARCQAPSKPNGKRHSHPALRLERCDRPATTVMVENKPRTGHPDYPEEGYIAAYSCCDQCREQILKRQGPDYAKFTPIEGASAAAAAAPVNVELAPPPLPSSNEGYQLSPDGKYRWRAGMKDWEPVPSA